MTEPTEAEIQTAAIACREPFPLIPPEAKAPITAAQAKIEAVANLTMKAYDRAATLQLTPNEAKALQADFPDEAFQPGAAGKDYLLYIEHAYLRDRLTQVLGLGQWAIIPRNRWGEDFTYEKFDKYTKQTTTESATRIYVEAMLVVRGAFVGEAVGAMEYYPKNQSQNYGDAVEGAKTAAFRRCCKELSIGLQAWKKDWCEGWWQRKRQNTPRNAAPSNLPARPPANAPGASQSVPTAVSVASKTTPKPFPTAATLAWMLKELKARPLDPARKLVSEYFEKAGAILPTEELEDLPLRFVPNTPKQLRDLGLAIAAFEQGEEAGLAFKPHDEPESTIKTSQKAQNIQAEPNGQQALTHPDPDIMNMIVTVPRKGQKKADYMAHPDTIGSLYENRHNSEEDRRRLFGFARWEPSGWTKDNGQVMPPSDSDLKFKAAHTKFMEWFKANHAAECREKEAA